MKIIIFILGLLLVGCGDGKIYKVCFQDEDSKFVGCFPNTKSLDSYEHHLRSNGVYICKAFGRLGYSCYFPVHVYEDEYTYRKANASEQCYCPKGTGL